jgi:hypothetical protein
LSAHLGEAWAIAVVVLACGALTAGLLLLGRLADHLLSRCSSHDDGR